VASGLIDVGPSPQIRILLAEILLGGRVVAKKKVAKKAAKKPVRKVAKKKVAKKAKRKVAKKAKK
jgi:hypothetical protein